MGYDPGNTLRLKVSFTDPATGQAFDPATVVFEVLRANDTVAITPAVVKDAVGQYHALQYLDFLHPGIWSWRITGTSPSVGGERTFTVNTSRFSS